MAERGNKSEALDMANGLVADNPNCVPALKLQGMLLEETGRRFEASRVYIKALQLASNDSELLLKLGTYHLAAGENDAAIRMFARYLAVRPRSGEALFYLAQAYQLNGQNALALKAIRDCVGAEPNRAQFRQKYGELLCLSRDNESGLRQLLKAQAMDPTLDRIDFEIAAASYRLKDFSRAAQYSARAVRKQPTELEALELLASAEMELLKWQEAGAVFERILAIKSDDPDALLGAGRCKLELRSFEPAVHDFEKALEVQPDLALAHFYLSRAFAGLGRAAEAQHEAQLHHFMQQMSFAPSELGNEGDKDSWAKAKQLLMDHREDDALRQFQRSATQPAASSADPYVFVGSLYLSIGDEENGLRTLGRALEIDPKVRGAHTYLGKVALQHDDLKTAEKQFEAELANDPNYQTARAELGKVRYRQGRWRDAAELLFRSRTRVPELLYMLCDSYFHVGRTSDARLIAEMLVAYSGRDPELLQRVAELLSRNGQVDLASRVFSNLPK